MAVKQERLVSREDVERIAVKITHLDDLLSLTGEVIINSSNLHLLHKGLQESFDSRQGVKKELLEMLKVSSLAANRISSDLHSLVMDVRMIEVRDTFNSFRRVVRDIGRKTEKEIILTISGEDTMVDKAMVEKLSDPLNHLIRNAADHGIESPVERKKAGKVNAPEIILNAYTKEKYTYIEVADNGKGIDLAKVRKKGILFGFVNEEEAKNCSKEELISFLFYPGFTTAKKATDISGRGVGMDVVKNNIESLGGTVKIDTEKGVGTKVVMKIPELAAVNITDALTLRAASDCYAIPINSVVATLGINKKDINTTFSKETILYLGDIITLHDLTNLLYRGGLRTAGKEKSISNEETETIPVIIIESKNDKIGLKVSEFMAPQKLVILPLPEEYFHVRGVSGMTIMGGNRLGIIVDPKNLIALATDKPDGTYEIQIDIFSKENEDISVESVVPGSSKDPQEKVDKEENLLPKEEEVVFSKGNSEFFLEVENLCQELDNAIFKLEKKRDDGELIHTIFRYFHSVKGDLVMVGCPHTLVDFVHSVETVLDRARAKEIEVTDEIIDIFLDSVSLVKESIVQIKKEGVFSGIDPEIAGRLEPYIISRKSSHSISKEETQERGFSLSPLLAFGLLQKRLAGWNVYHVYIEVSSSFQENYLAAFLILKRISVIGDIVATIPELAEWEDSTGGAFKFLLASKKDEKELERFIQEWVKDDYEVSDYQIVVR